MTTERGDETIEFGSRIFIDPGHPGNLWINGHKLENSAKRARIPAEVLNDLESLAIAAFPGESDYAHDQSFLNESLEKLSKKYPNEEPQEVWRRDIAGLVARGIDAKSIATSLFNGNERLTTSLNLNSLSPEGKEKAIQNIKKKVMEYWPSSKNSR